MTTNARATMLDYSVEELHELAEVERLLRLDSRAFEPKVDVGASAARISWESWTLNEHARGSLTASVVNELAATDAWGVATIHDPMERPDDDMVVSLLSVVHAPEKGDGG